MSISTHACVCAHLGRYVPLVIGHTARNCTVMHWLARSCWGQDPELSLAESSAPGFQRLQCRYQPGLGSHQKTQLGKKPLPRSDGHWWGFSFSQAVGLRTLVPHWVLAKRNHQCLDMMGSSVLCVILDSTIPRKYYCVT